jgi:hypothetical protein
MPPVVLAVAAVAALVLLVLAALPAIVLTRPARAARVRAAAARPLLLWWVAALIPWATVAVATVLPVNITVSIHSTAKLVLAVLVLLVLWALLVVLPVGVITATLLWAQARRRPQEVLER